MTLFSARLTKHFSLLVFLLAGFPVTSSFAQDAVPEKILNSVKEATVFIRVTQGRRSSTGSGFLIRKIDDWAYIVTNEHVVRTWGKQSRTVQVDFNSGSKNRKTFLARVVSEDKSRDLAVLKIKNRDLPKPISLTSPNVIRETVTVHILGYPFGKALSTSRNGPSVTIGRGTISSIHNDDNGDLEEVQIDGDINPGNSGGPIVFGDGSLMGVSVATVTGTQIGVGIPGESVLELLKGRAGGLAIGQSKGGPQSIEVSFTAKLIDPLAKLKNVSVLYIPKSGLNEMKANKDGTWPRVSGEMKEVELEINGQTATAKQKITGEFGSKLTFVHQLKFTNGEGNTTHTSPAEFIVRIPRKPRDRNIFSDDDDWIGDPGKKEKERNKEDWIGGTDSVGNPVDSHRSLKGNPFVCVDAKCRNLKIGKDKLVPNVVWGRDHESFFVLSKRGMLRKISFPDFVELKTLDFDAECSWMGLSQEGLCVLVNSKQDLVVLDEKSLTQKRKLPIGIAKRFGSSPGSDLVFLSTEQHQLVIADVKSGKKIETYDIGDFNSMQVERHERAGPISEVKMPTVSPDGKHCFLVASGCLHKFSIVNREVVYEQVGARIADNPGRVEISADSKYIALPSGGGNGKRGYSTYIYKVSNILDKVIEINGGAYPRALALDKQAGLIYGQGEGFNLRTFTPQGEVQKNYKFDRRSSQTVQILVHPTGRKVLVLKSTGITSVELPE